MTWSRSEIRQARQIPLKPLLLKMGYRLEAINSGNYVVHGLLYEVVIKENYWVCTENDTAGNSIDFLVKIKGMTFSKAMNLLLS